MKLLIIFLLFVLYFVVGGALLGIFEKVDPKAVKEYDDSTKAILIILWPLWIIAGIGSFAVAIGFVLIRGKKKPEEEENE